MAYTVFARKYRPQTFEDLVGQEHVTRTLSNAITSERVAHAFLFTGVRGVGKTTTARILAKALNCENGPTPTPCGTCDVCVDITAGRDTDVQEMDGASNNSVEDVRRLQESIPYRPARDRFKVVIVDEVHMLSTGAFNAFLKTLEEPPPHVKFIFATTEAHKVPVTIRSRCQRYDFRLIPQAVVAGRVREILAAESIEADKDAVSMVAREAAGSMRDALTLLDQIVAFGGDSLAGDEVARVLGIAGRDAVHTIAKAVLGGDGAGVLNQVEVLAQNGLDMLHFARQLLDLFRDMVVLQVTGGETTLVTLVDEERQRALEVGASVDLQELQRSFSGLSKIVDDVAQSGAPRTTLEMGLVRLATRPPLLPLAELIARLDALERRGGGGGGPRRGGGGGGGRAGSGGTPRAAQASSAARATSSQASAAPPHPPATQASTAATQPSEPTRAVPEVVAEAAAPIERAAAVAPRSEPPPEPEPTPEPAVEPEPIPEPEPEPPTASAAHPAAPVVSPPSAPPAPLPDTANAGAPSELDPSALDPSASTPEAAVAPEPASTPDEPALSAVPASAPDRHPAPDTTGTWEEIVSRVMGARPALGAVLKHGVALEVSGDKIVLGFAPGSFFGQQAEALGGRQGIADAAEGVLGTRPTVEVTVADQTKNSQTLVDVENGRREARIQAKKERALNHPLVRAAQELFGIDQREMNVRVELD